MAWPKKKPKSVIRSPSRSTFLSLETGPTANRLTPRVRAFDRTVGADVQDSSRVVRRDVRFDSPRVRSMIARVVRTFEASRRAARAGCRRQHTEARRDERDATRRDDGRVFKTAIDSTDGIID